MGKHLIKIENPEHVAMSATHTGNDQQYCEAGETVRLKWQPTTGWGLQEAHYTDAGGNVVSIDLDTREFTMPASAIVVSGTAKRFVVQDWTEGKEPHTGELFEVGENGEPVPSGINASDVATDQELERKADKVQDAVAGNLAGLDENGNITDSGIPQELVEILAGTSTALIYYDANGKIHFANPYTANETTGALFPTDYPDAKKVISIGTWQDKSASGNVASYFGTYANGNNTVVEFALIIPDNVTNLRMAFRLMTALISAKLSGGGKVTNMYAVFSNCSSLENLDLTGFDTAAVTNMYAMFANCSSLKNLDLTGFDTAAVTTMQSMFNNCSSLENLDLTGFDTAAVTNMSYMFSNCSSLENLDLTGFDTAAVTNMQSMFNNCLKLVKFIAPKEYTCKMQVSFASSSDLQVESVDEIIKWLFDFETNVPLPYDNTATYVVGDIVEYDSRTFICSTAITVAEEWNAAHWSETTRTLILNAKAKQAYDAVYGIDACGQAVTAKGWTLA